MELILSSNKRDSVELRTWADYTFSRWFLNLPGVAAIEVGGGLEREIHVIADQERLNSVGLTLTDLSDLVQRENSDAPAGRLLSANTEISTRTRGRFNVVSELSELPLWSGEASRVDDVLKLSDVADVIDTHSDERIRIRLNKEPGVKVSVQKQPTANTVTIVDEVYHRLDFLKDQKLIPDDISVNMVGDQSTYVRHALNNASLAAFSGAILAMTVIYLFLGNIARTLIIGTAIPIGTLVTFAIMDINGLTLNIMTLGGLALGMGLLIDSTIVMLENITRHQDDTGSSHEKAVAAAKEVNSPIVASTGTNLAAILPFLFIGGLTGLLFEELIITITSAMLSALIVALTLVPALGSRVKSRPDNAQLFNKLFITLKARYHSIVQHVLKHSVAVLLVFITGMAFAYYTLINSQFKEFPSLDEGDVSIYVTGDPGITLDEMDNTVTSIESLLLEQPDVETVFTTAGGSVFGRSEFESSNRSSIRVKLVTLAERNISSDAWIKRMQKEIKAMNFVGFKVHMRVRGVRGLHLGSGDDDISLRIQGQNLETLRTLGDEVVNRLRDIEGIRNLEHTYEDNSEELNINIDRQRSADLGIHTDTLGDILRIALDGMVISEFLDDDRQFDIRLRLPRKYTKTPEALENLLVGLHQGQPVRLHEIANIKRGPAPSNIKHDRQQRIVEIAASLIQSGNLETITQNISQKLEDLELPDGYYLYDAGASKTLAQSKQSGFLLLLLAVFLVFVVMAVQYESLRNPLVIIFSVPFAAIGVALGISIVDMPISMPVWLGFIMLAGIVVNNSIVLVEQIEIERGKHPAVEDAVSNAASLRLRPILMTTLTTVFGMLPLALGLGEGSEMLQPLAFVIVWGLSFSMLVSLVLIPAMYTLFHTNISDYYLTKTKQAD
jgi:multidrug efflux pump subunit AcrB